MGPGGPGDELGRRSESPLDELGDCCCGRCQGVGVARRRLDGDETGEVVDHGVEVETSALHGATVAMTRAPGGPATWLAAASGAELFDHDVQRTATDGSPRRPRCVSARSPRGAHASAGRPARRANAADARPAPRGGGDARRRVGHLVHVARAGPSDQRLGRRAAGDREGVAPRRRRHRPPGCARAAVAAGAAVAHRRATAPTTSPLPCAASSTPSNRHRHTSSDRAGSSPRGTRPRPGCTRRSTRCPTATAPCCGCSSATRRRAISSSTGTSTPARRSPSSAPRRRRGERTR